MDERYREVLGERFPGASRAVTDERFGVLRGQDPVVYGRPMSDTATRLTMSIKDTARHLNVHRATVYRWIDEGKLRETRIGRRRLVITESVLRLVNGEAPDATGPERPAPEAGTTAQRDSPEAA